MPRVRYQKFSSEQEAQVARYVMESGDNRAIVRYSKQWGVNLEESEAEPLPNFKQGRTLLLGKELDTAVKAYVENK